MMVTYSFSVNALKVLIIKQDRKFRGRYQVCMKYMYQQLGHNCGLYHQTMLYLESFLIFLFQIVYKIIIQTVFAGAVKLYTSVCLPTIFGVIFQHPGIVM